MKRILTATIIILTSLVILLITLNTKQETITHDYLTNEKEITEDDINQIRDNLQEILTELNLQTTINQEEINLLTDLLNGKKFSELTTFLDDLKELLKERNLNETTINYIIKIIENGLDDLLQPIESNYTYTPTITFNQESVLLINNLITNELQLLETQIKISNPPYESINSLIKQLNNTAKSIENYNQFFNNLATELTNNLIIIDPELTVNKIINNMRIQTDLAVLLEPIEIKESDINRIIKIINSLPYPELNLRNPGIRDGYNTANFNQIQSLIPNKTGYLVEYDFVNNYYLVYMMLDSSIIDELKQNEHLELTINNTDIYCNNCTNKISINNETYNYYNCNNCINNKIITDINKTTYYQFITNSFKINIIPYNEYAIGIYMDNTDTTINEIITLLTNSAAALIDYLK